MEAIIKTSLDRGITYQNYRDLVKQLVAENSTTGNLKTEDLVNYTKLNDKRMNRWDKTLKISEPYQDKIKAFKQQLTWLVIVESWCGDAAHILPVLNKIAELNDFIDLKIVLRDENPELMDAFLTNGARSVPKLIVLDDNYSDVLCTYGPRPSEATNFVSRYKSKYGSLTPEFKEDLQHWYNTDKGQNVLEDIIEILCQLEPSFCQ